MGWSDKIITIYELAIMRLKLREKINNYKNVMNCKSTIALMLFSAFLLESCDPVFSLQFINKTNGPAKVKFLMDSKNKIRCFQQVSVGDSIVLNLKGKDSISIIQCDIGTWSDDKIVELAKSIKSLEIETTEIKTVFKTSKSIEDILKNNTEGVLNTEIVIEIE